MSAEVNVISNLIPQIINDISNAVANAMNEWCEDTMTLAKERTPVDGGTLRASGTVEPPVYSGDVVTQSLGFGGAASAYALEQHERLDFAHATGQAKFLESAVNDREAKLVAMVKKAVRDVTG